MLKERDGCTCYDETVRVCPLPHHRYGSDVKPDDVRVYVLEAMQAWSRIYFGHVHDTLRTHTKRPLEQTVTKMLTDAYHHTTAAERIMTNEAVLRLAAQIAESTPMEGSVSVSGWLQHAAAFWDVATAADDGGKDE